MAHKLPRDVGLDPQYVSQYQPHNEGGRTLPSAFLGPPRYPKQLQRRLDLAREPQHETLPREAPIEDTATNYYSSRHPESDYGPLSQHLRPAGASLQMPYHFRPEEPMEIVDNKSYHRDMASSALSGLNSRLDMAAASRLAPANGQVPIAPLQNTFAESELIDDGIHLDAAQMVLPHGVLLPEMDYGDGGRAMMEAQPKKVAPRSIDLFRVGPPFEPTVLHNALYCQETGELIVPDMTTRIDRGFELGAKGNWIGYKRNYVTLVLTYVFKGWSWDDFLAHQYFVVDANDALRRVPVRYFALRIAVRCNDPEVKIGLVQHTPKRDKGPQYATPVYPAVPGGVLPEHQTVKASCNKRNMSKIASLRRIFGFDRAQYYDEHGTSAAADTSVLKNYPTDVLTKVARFERIQFTASLRVKVNHVNRKHFTLSVELVGVADGGDGEHEVLLASSSSVPLLVRGRSPSNYNLEKTSGYRGPDP